MRKREREKETVTLTFQNEKKIGKLLETLKFSLNK